MEMLVRSGCDRQPTASWIGYEDFGYPTSIVVRKGGEESIDLVLRMSGRLSDSAGDIIACCPKIEMIDSETRYGLDLYRMSQTSAGGAVVRLPKDGPEGAYRITAPDYGFHICYADCRSPMVV